MGRNRPTKVTLSIHDLLLVALFMDIGITSSGFT
jgi:hypothetical protein